MMPQATYPLAALILVVAALTGSAQAQEARLVPVTIDGERVRLYPLSHSRANFDAFRAAGGRGAFHELPPEFGGHYIWRRPDRWGPLVEAYLKVLGLSR